MASEWEGLARALGLEPPPDEAGAPGAPSALPLVPEASANPALGPTLGRLAGGLARGAVQYVATPDLLASTPNPYPPGSEEAIEFERTRQQAGLDWTNQAALGNLGSPLGPPKGAFGAGGFLANAPSALDEVEQVLAALKAVRGAKAASASPALSDAAIEKQLAANPGASIFDVAGVQPASSPYAPKSIGGFEPAEQHFALGSFPREVPYLPPEQALAHGFVTPAVHGTRLDEHRWSVPGQGEDFNIGDLGGFGVAHSAGKDALRLPDDELGVHFGTPEQAHYFTSNVTGGGYLPRTYPTVLQTGKSLEMPDMGTWHLPKLNDALDRLNTGKGYGVGHGARQVDDPEAHLGEFPPSERADIEDIEGMRDYLRSKGYNSVRYKNSVEGEGTSYIMFNPSPEEPKFVAGVRSPFAAFDPSKLARPELAAGLAGVTAAPVLFDEHNRPYFLTK